VTSDSFPDVAKSMGELLKTSKEEIKSNQDRITNARQVVVRAAEEKKAQLAAAAAKKSKQGKKGAKNNNDAGVEDQETTIRS